MLSIAINVIFWRTDWPILADSLLTEVEFNEFLQLVVSAARSVGEPVDCLSFTNQAKAQKQEGEVEVVLRRLAVIGCELIGVSRSLVDACYEDPEGQSIQAFHRLGISTLVLLHSICVVMWCMVGAVPSSL